MKVRIHCNHCEQSLRLNTYGVYSTELYCASQKCPLAFRAIWLPINKRYIGF
ncbi:hypothetical protein SEA_BADULIA_1 [Microbacterium phage Badulia]|nr:hypothetical protein SEA_BADULIA_1 [Microbacterium phage Badulia]